MSATQGRILVIRGGAIGDFILTLPVLAALRAAFPTAHLTVLGYPHIAGLAAAGGLADAVQPIEGRGLALFFGRNHPLPAEESTFFSRFDLIISYLYDPDHLFETNVRRVSRAQYLAGPHRPGANPDLHATDTFLEPLQRLAIFDADPVPRLDLSRSPDRQAGVRSDPAGPGGRRRLAAHPGSGSEAKNWPETCWSAFLPGLARQTDWDLLLIGGEAEGDRVERLAALWPADRLRVMRNVPLVELAVELAGCQTFLGHDSGITHLAAALGLPGLVLWGGTNEQWWRPRGEGWRLLRHDQGLPALAPEAVLAGLLPLLS